MHFLTCSTDKVAFKTNGTHGCYQQMLIILSFHPLLCYGYWEIKRAHMHEIKQSIHYHVL